MGARRRPRTRMIVAAGVVCVTGAIGTGVAVHHAAVATPLPAATASSKEVLAVYLRAAKARDCDVTGALTLPSDDPAMGWCGGGFWTALQNRPELISYTNVGAVIRDDGGSASGGVEECIPVDIVEDHMTGAEPGAMPGWQFCFDKTPVGWRLADEGYG